MNMYELLLQNQTKQEIGRVIECNDISARYGLTLTEEQAGKLVLAKQETLKKTKRVEFGNGVIDKLIYAFCDSSYILNDDYYETLEELQEIFYMFKNESCDLLTDEELITFMREQFDDICYGDIDYLADTCLERFTRAIRAGYVGFHATGAQGEYKNFTEEVRWDRNLYLQALEAKE